MLHCCWTLVYCVLICEGMAWNMFLCVYVCNCVGLHTYFIYHTQYVPVLMHVPGGYFVVVYASAPCMSLGIVEVTELTP